MSQNTGLKFLSFIIALILWSYVRITLGGFGQTKISQLEVQVPLILKGNTSLIVYERGTDTITVTLRGDSRIIETLRGSLVSAFIDIETLQAGSHVPEVRVVAPAGVEILSKKPASVPLSLSTYMVREVPARVVTQGKVKKGYELGTPSISPNTIKLEGPEALLLQVSSVLVNVPIQNREKSFSAQAQTLEAVNENSTAVMAKSIKMNPKEVSVLIPIERTESLLNLPVTLEKVKFGQVPGYTYTTEIEPQFVQVGSRLPEGEPEPTGLTTESYTFPASGKVQQKQLRLTPIEGIEFKGTREVTIRLIPTKIEKPKPQPSPTP